MIQLLQLNGTDDDVLNISLTEIIECLPNKVNPYWTILDIEGMGCKEKVNVPIMESIIKNTPNGLHLSLNTIIELVNNLNDIHNLLIIGDEDMSKLTRYSSLEETYSNCSFCLNLFDSSYWEVATSDKEFASNLKQRLI
jgi:hypothetical protein